MTGYGAAIFPQHAEMLRASAISPDVAAERGYRSVDTRRQLPDAFGDYQRRTPGLLIPVHDTSGAVALWQYRPNRPRVNNRTGKSVKYETPGGRTMTLDVPPRIRGQLADPTVPLWVTEGVKKADAAVSAGLCCIALLGVWNWRGTNTLGGKTALPAWADIALNGRRVYVAYDSDVMTNPKVHAALADIGGYLAYKGADVRYCYLLDGGDAKVGLDDYLAAGGSIDALITSAQPQPQPRQPQAAQAPPAAKPVPDVQPWDGDPAALLGDVHAFLRSYVVFPSAHAAAAVTLWAAHTHMAAAFDSTPRLALVSPEKRCGKSRVLELLELLCAGAETLSDASPAYLYRRIGTEGAGPVTILLDEADAIWKRGKKDETAEALRSVVNAGHRRGATVGRVEMNGQGANLVRFPVYAPAAIAGIGNLPDTIMDRAAIIRMRRRPPDQRVQEKRERVVRPRGEELRGQLAAWAEQAVGRVGESWPDMPPGVTDRAADVWEPLIVVADLAGGCWPELAREACAALVGGTQDDSETAGTRLLADLRAIFGDAEAMPTEAILGKLRALEEAPWGDWYGRPLDARGLAKLLRPYEIRPAVVRIGDSTPRGYRRADLHDAWRSYLPGVPATSATSATLLISDVADVADVADTPRNCTVCGAPLDQSFIDAGFTDHGEDL